MPSLILAIETSTPLGSVAVVCDGEIRFEQSFSSARSHNSQLFAPLREALAVCEGSLRAIVVGTGPASYTGVRIGIAAAQGVALARNIPVFGLPSVLAVDSPATSYHVCGDARRGTYFVAEVHKGALANGIEPFDADGLRHRRAESQVECPWFTFDVKVPLELPQVRCVNPSAARLAIVAATLSDVALESLSQKPLEPVYLSAPFVTLPK